MPSSLFSFAFFSSFWRVARRASNALTSFSAATASAAISSSVAFAPAAMSASTWAISFCLPAMRSCRRFTHGSLLRPSISFCFASISFERTPSRSLFASLSCWRVACSVFSASSAFTSSARRGPTASSIRAS